MISCKNKEQGELSSQDIENLDLQIDRMNIENDNSAWENLDDVLKNNLDNEYLKTRDKREFFQKYYYLGVPVLLGFIENKFLYCHSQGHDLGKTIFSKVMDFDESLKLCGDGCTNGCMHGVISEAFGDEKYKDILKSVNGLCGDISTNFATNNYEDVAIGMSQFCDTGEMSNMHKRGNCAHAMGHAVMVLAQNNLSTAMETCKSFEDEGMGYYCATGAFMEYVDDILASRKLDITEKGKTDHYPCDVYDDYPAACYRYMLRLVGYRKGIKESRNMVDECKKLEPHLRRGCFHGLGASITRQVDKDPYLVNLICSEGNEEDAIMCIEGAIEKLADFDEKTAHKVCATLIGNNRKVCEDAANEKMYRPDKQSLALYCK